MPRSGPSQTSLLHAGRPKTGWVNMPVSRASTYIFETMEALHDARARRDSERVASYGARGTDSTMALEELIETLEGGFRSHLFPTGQAAIAVVLAGFLSAGDHIPAERCRVRTGQKICDARTDPAGNRTHDLQP